MATKRIPILTTAAVLSAIGTSALAYDTKVLPGAACQPFSLMHGDFYVFPSRIYNNNGRTADVICPVVRDRAYNSNGVEYVKVYVRGNARAERIGCTLYSYDWKGNSVASHTVSTYQTTPVALTLDVGKSASSGYYSVTCSLPADGAVLGYRVLEFEPTDGNN